MAAFIPCPAPDRHPDKFAIRSASADSSIHRPYQPWVTNPWSRSSEVGNLTAGSTYPIDIPPIDVHTGYINPEWLGQFLVDVSLHPAGAAPCLVSQGLKPTLTFCQASENRIRFLKHLLWPSLEEHLSSHPRPAPGLRVNNILGMIIWSNIMLTYPSDGTAVDYTLAHRPWVFARHASPGCLRSGFNSLGYAVSINVEGQVFLHSADTTGLERRNTEEVFLQCFLLIASQSAHLSQQQVGNAPRKRSDHPQIIPGLNAEVDGSLALLEADEFLCDFDL